MSKYAYTVVNPIQDIVDIMELRDYVQKLEDLRAADRMEYNQLSAEHGAAVLEIENLRSQVEALRRAIEKHEETRQPLVDLLLDDAEDFCHYGDNCPDNAGTRHGTCRSCNAGRALVAAGVLSAPKETTND